jgi:outer membrane protein OmpA-like peptidoglycan-associated protein
MTASKFTAGILAGGLILAWTTSHAQLGGLLDRARRAAEREIGQSVERNVGDVVGCVVGNDDCSDAADANDSNSATPSAVGATPANSGTGEQPGQGVWRNYDFTPGKRVIFASDWAGARVGRIPQDIRFVNGNMQVVERNGQKVLEFTNNSVFQIVLDEPLPRSFSLEFDAKAALPNIGISAYFETYTEERRAYQTYERNFLVVRGESGIAQRGGGFASSVAGMRNTSDDIAAIKFQHDDGYAIMYVGSERVGQIPNANIPESNVIEFVVNANANYPAYIANIVVAYDLDDPYDALMDTGRFTTRGIHFGINEASLRPESTPVLNQLVELLEDHADLTRVVIEGHTDNAGDDAYNQSLSERRAAAVKAYLVGNGLASERIDAVGLGETQPVADNATEAGRQENRRVVVSLP